MTSTSKHKEAAWTFMKFLMEDEQQLAMSKAGMIPTMKTAMDQAEYFGVSLCGDLYGTAEIGEPENSFRTVAPDRGNLKSGV